MKFVIAGKPSIARSLAKVIGANKFFVGTVIDFVFPVKGTLIAWVIWSGMFILLLIEGNKRER